MITKTCGSCNGSIPASITVGDHCPLCGVKFGGEKTTTIGGNAESTPMSGKTILVITLVLIFLGLGLVLIYVLPSQESAKKEFLQMNQKQMEMEKEINQLK